MRVIHDNFGSLPTNARESALGLRNDVELNNLWFCVTTAQGGNNPLSLTFIEEKKTEVDPGILLQLRWSSMWQRYLICF